MKKLFFIVISISALVSADSAHAYTFRFFNVTDQQVALNIPCGSNPINITLEAGKFNDIDYANLNCFPAIVQTKVNGQFDHLAIGQFGISAMQSRVQTNGGETWVVGKSVMTIVDGLLDEQSARIEDAKSEPVEPTLWPVQLSSAFMQFFAKSLGDLGLSDLAIAAYNNFTIYEYKYPYNLPTVYSLICGGENVFPLTIPVVASQDNSSTLMIGTISNGMVPLFANPNEVKMIFQMNLSKLTIMK